MLFLGLLFPKEDENILASKSNNHSLQNQVNSFQWNCIDGLYENNVKNIHIINFLPVGTYPSYYKDLFIPSKEWTYHGDKHHQVGGMNFHFIKQISRERKCKKFIHNSSDKEILIYSTYLPFLKAIKHLDESYNVTLIVPDMPEYYDYSHVGNIKKLLRKINNRVIYKCLKRVDRFVLLTEAMRDALCVGNRPYTIVEGVCPIDKKEIIGRINSNQKKILYTGSLNKKFGIDVLVNAFLSIPNNNYVLWICGSGDYENSILEVAKKDSRIKFFGYVSKAETMRLQSEATVLVNPRQNFGEYTKYSFPSKNIEYLLSGTPVVAYKLSGIPDEYDAYLNYVEDNSPQTLRDVLITVCEDDTGMYTKKATQAIDFLITEKSPKKQVEKILKIMNL